MTKLECRINDEVRMTNGQEDADWRAGGRSRWGFIDELMQELILRVL